MSYLAYHFIVTPPQPGSEILMAMIADMGFDSFDTTSSGFIGYIKEEDSGNVNFDELLFDSFEYNYSVEKIAQTNWNEEWEKNFEPVVVRDLLCIRAPFHPENKKVIYEIIIMPKMSFGTGHHQTTQLVCAAMFEHDFHGKRVLDMGCGTGVLAILAKVLGATDILGIDIDEWSVENSIENCATNNASTIVIKKGDIDLLEKQKNFDIILANINKNILKRQIPVYSQKINSGGKLFLSGFFKTDASELIEVCVSHKFKLDSQNSKDEWTMLVMEKL
ncbi:MAG: ribosomal protein methyltransferase [Bacteroidetes bacterium]|jgi:ribosomal protein L11 methyltransferase|nr:ribosomal protein methyltransferase [Bacteroidota bacterium]